MLACVVLLAGCASDYRLVRPDGTTAGSYYTSTGPYASRGYYDYYGTGPYYAQTSGWGYYNGTAPYVGPFGYGGWYDNGYWPGFTIGPGFSSVWNFPGYWGPWYSGHATYPWWCGQRRCHHRRDDSHGADDPQNLGVVSVRPTLPSNAPIPQTTRKLALPHDFGVRNANRREPVRFNNNTRFVRAPVDRLTAPRPGNIRSTPIRALQPRSGHTRQPLPMAVTQPHSDGFRPAPQRAPRPSFQPHASAPERVATPRPRDGRDNDSRRH